ncbi:GAF domain-containing protein, partial [Pleurocapsales cyanobacterium LEGE 10410]|nr:GAF domain-containing protein [Pleurocapsales cyanobacterium LEGE 10410]
MSRNQKEGFDQLIKWLQDSESTLTPSQKQQILELIGTKVRQPHAELLNAVAKASVTLSGSADDIEDLFHVFSMVGEAAEVDRVYFFKNYEVNSEPGVVYSRQVAEWVRDSVSSQLENELLQSLSQSDYPGMYNLFAKGEPFKAIVADIEDAKLRKLFQSQDILSILQLPLFVDGRFYGFIGFDDCTHEKKWTTGEISALEILAVQLTQRFETKIVREQLEN